MFSAVGSTSRWAGGAGLATPPAQARPALELAHQRGEVHAGRVVARLIDDVAQRELGQGLRVRGARRRARLGELQSPVDGCEDRCLKEIREGLKRLGARER